jgi:hypothetical protein
MAARQALVIDQVRQVGPDLRFTLRPGPCNAAADSGDS